MNISKALLLVFALVMVLPGRAFSETSPASSEHELDLADVPAEPKDHPRWIESLKSKYSLTQADIDAMKAKGIAYPQMAMVSELALKSGKTRDEIIAMRVDQKMGWGKIAKTLNLPPGTIGHAVSDLRHEIRDEKLEKREEKLAKREEKLAKREEKLAKRDEKRAEREARKK